VPLDPPRLPSDTSAENAEGGAKIAVVDEGSDDAQSDGQIDGQKKGSEVGQMERAESEWDAVGMESALVLSPTQL